MILNGRFQIFLRRRQNTYIFPGTDYPVNVVVQCNATTGYAEYVAGDVDNTWYDFTNYIEDTEKLSLTWDKTNTGDSTNTETTQDGSNYDKGISSDLLFFDAAYQFIYDWLLTTECQILNSVEVKIVDLIAGNYYRIFEIKVDNLEYAPVDAPCQFKIKLREQDNIWHCIHKTFIWDNWQHWFEDSTVKSHPCFLTCIEPRPRLLQSARMALTIFYHSADLVLLGAVGFVIDLIFAENIKDETRRILNINRFVDAPLIRTYIENVAGKCGMTTDTIFDIDQPWENLCLYYPQAGYMHESNEKEVTSPSLAYHFDNRWMVTISDLFDKLKIVFAAEWYVTPNNTIVFKHKKDLINLAPIYDFTAPGAEPIYDLIYTFNGDKKPAYGKYEYTDDGSDLASQEASTLYNDIIDYDGAAFNPMLEGEKVKSFEFAPTGFMRDGRSKDYIKLLIDDGKKGALILMVIIAIVTFALLGGGTTILAAGIILGIGITMVAVIAARATDLKDEFVNNPIYNGAVRVTSEQTMQPRLLLWDGGRMDRAKVVKEVALPQPNLFYNNNPTKLYDQKNRIDIDNSDKSLYNYPLYFDGDFVGNMFDKYHDPVDNPLHSLETHQDAKWDVDLCTFMLNLFGVFHDQYAAIGKIVKLEKRGAYDVFVRIGNINIDYGENKINLRGTVIRRAAEQPVVPICETFQINERCLIINESHIVINAA